MPNTTKVTFRYTKNNFLMNDFSLLLSKHLSLINTDFEKRPGFEAGANNHQLLNDGEKYTTRVFKIQSDLRRISEQLTHIRIFLNRYPFRQYYMDKGISQLEYIQYHTEALYHKVHTILEIMRLLVNEVYSLKIPAKDCSWIKMCQNLKKTEKPMKMLEAYFNTFKNMIDLRHLNSHRGYYEDEEKDNIDLKLGLFLHRDDYPIDEETKNKFPIRYINYFLKEHKKERVKLVEQVIEANEKLLTKFLASLFDRYSLQHTAFDESR